MHCRAPLKRILTDTKRYWDQPQTRPAVRENFARMINCGTPALGAEIYASDTEEKLIYHTCKSRACPSCGHRATLQWQREQWASLPDVPYAGVVFTMPDVLWPVFQQNRHLLHDLPTLGAAVIQQWVKLRYGARIAIMVMPHTFGARLNFNCHLHILVSAGGLKLSDGSWISRLNFRKQELMGRWRFAVTSFVLEALNAGVLRSHLKPASLRTILTVESSRWWSIHIDHFQSKAHFLRYAGRYARRLPLAQHRLGYPTETRVCFQVKDKKLKTISTVECSPVEFVTRLAEHVPDRYRNLVRYYGLLAPRLKAQSSSAIFLLLRQERRFRPRRMSWGFSLRKDFGVDPRFDHRGQRMFWVGRLPAST